MHPTTFLLGILFGSALAMLGGMLFVLLFFALRAEDYPQIQAEWQNLLWLSAWALGLAVLSGIGLKQSLKRTKMAKYWGLACGIWLLGGWGLYLAF